MAGIEPNPGPLSRSPQENVRLDMQKRGRGRPRKENVKVFNSECSEEETLCGELFHLEEESAGYNSGPLKSSKISEYFEPSSLKEPQLNHDIHDIKNELQCMKEENKRYQEELQMLSQEMKKLDVLVKHNSQLKGTLEFELDKLVNEKTKNNIVIINFPFLNTDYINEIEFFIKNVLEIENCSVETLIKLRDKDTNPMIKISVDGEHNRNLILSKFWKSRVKFNNERYKNVIFTTDICRRSRLRRKKLMPIIKQEKIKGNKIIVRDDYYIQGKNIFTYDINSNSVIQLDDFLE
ncbi:uncharacterized protein LOC111637633 [Centruroides sculpturatus]|uniref:uncharacterized protein LOC111637633 n=1 Tax=Centruroides sculpturatus TaxID=218467 RepID=UPI000C6D84D5|nr:uncharacterized protein LOC111637633 [Centruroides sculpturatus]